MDKIEELRNSLHNAMNNGNQKEILNLSKRLDKRIVRFLKEVNPKRIRVKF